MKEKSPKSYTRQELECMLDDADAVMKYNDLQIALEMENQQISRIVNDDALYEHHLSEAQRCHRMIADVMGGMSQRDMVFALKYALWECEEHDKGIIYLADERG